MDPNMQVDKKQAWIFSTSYKPKPMFHNPKQNIFIEF
jgi:hypothetical protein